MSSSPSYSTQPQEWNGERVDSIWIYEEDNTIRIPSGNQAVGISVMRRRTRGWRSRWDEPHRFVCKCYIITASRAADHIGGIKYVKREVENLRRCDHPNILRCVDFAYNPSLPRLAQVWTEYCSIGDLEQFDLHNPGRRSALTQAECAQVFYQLAKALLYLHHGVSKTDSALTSAELAAVRSPAAGGQLGQHVWQAILHRDIKPANVFVTMRNTGVIHVKLGDFGISRLDTVGTMTNVYSHQFAAPEQMLTAPGGIGASSKSDIFSLGRTIRRIFTEGDSPTNPRDTCVARLALWCQQPAPANRPSGIEIIDTLKPYMEPNSGLPMIYDAANSFLARIDKSAVPYKRTTQLCGRLCVIGKAQYDEVVPALTQLLPYAQTVTNTVFHLSPAATPNTGQAPQVETLQSRGLDRTQAQRIRALSGKNIDIQLIALFGVEEGSEDEDEDENDSEDEVDDDDETEDDDDDDDDDPDPDSDLEEDNAQRGSSANNLAQAAITPSMLQRLGRTEIMGTSQRPRVQPQRQRAQLQRQRIQPATSSCVILEDDDVNLPVTAIDPRTGRRVHPPAMNEPVASHPQIPQGIVPSVPFSFRNSAPARLYQRDYAPYPPNMHEPVTSNPQIPQGDLQASTRRAATSIDPRTGGMARPPTTSAVPSGSYVLPHRGPRQALSQQRPTGSQQEGRLGGNSQNQHPRQSLN